MKKFKVIPEEYLKQSFSKDEIDNLLEKYKLFKYAEYQGSFKWLFDAYPFLNKFITAGNSEYPNFSSELINKEIGFELIPYQAILSSFTINVIINAYKEKHNE